MTARLEAGTSLDPLPMYTSIASLLHFQPSLFFIMPRVKKKGGSELPPSVNGERILEKLDDEILKTYQQKVNKWNRLVHTLAVWKSL
jgi:hypothetical protein